MPDARTRSKRAEDKFTDSTERDDEDDAVIATAAYKLLSKHNRHPEKVSVQSRIDAEQRRPRAQSKPKKSNPAVRPFDHHGIADGVSVGVGADAHHTGLSPQGPASPVRQ